MIINIMIKTIDEIVLLYQSALLVSQTLGMLASEIKPGITTLYLDNLAEQFIRDNGGIPAFLGLYGFPNTICVSPNDQVVHGIPNKIPLREGDILSIDCGVKINGYCGDQAYTFEIGEVHHKIKKLIDITQEALYKGIAFCKKGNSIGDIGFAIQTHAESHGYSVVREFVGHGIGKQIHEHPQVPNYGKRGKGVKLMEGMVLSIEPMVNYGTHKIKIDDWLITTADKQYSAHFEHNVAIIDGSPYLLSTFKYIYNVLGLDFTLESPFKLLK